MTTGMTTPGRSGVGEVAEATGRPIEQVTPASRPAGALTAWLVIAGRNIRRVVRTPQLIVIGTAQGALFLLIFRYVFGGAIDFGGVLGARSRSVPYVDFLVPGYVVSTVLFSGSATAAGVAEDIQQGFADRLRSLPLPRTAPLIGRSLADIVFLTWGLVVATTIAFLVGFRIHGSPAAAVGAFLLCVVYGYAFMWLFISIGSLAGNAQAAQSMSMFVLPLTAVSSAYVPVDTMPGWLRAIASNQPVTVMTNTVRSLVLGDPSVAGLGHGTGYWVLLSLLWCALLMVVSVPLAVVRSRPA